MGELLLCLLIADFLTGLLHWIEDTYGLPSWPLLGQHVIEPNIRHHEQPGLIGTMSTIVSRNYQTMIPALLATVVFVLCFGRIGYDLALIGLLAGLGNEVHTWCHRSQNPGWIVFLQNCGLVQSPRQHAKHHRKPFTSHYCTLTNFTNEVLEATRFWRGLEWLVEQTLGVSPKRMSAARRGV